MGQALGTDQAPPAIPSPGCAVLLLPGKLPFLLHSPSHMASIKYSSTTLGKNKLPSPFGSLCGARLSGQLHVPEKKELMAVSSEPRAGAD